MTAAARLQETDELDGDDELGGDGDHFDAEMSPEDWAKLNAVIAESDAAYARGESLPAEVLLDDLRRIYAHK
ncbi:MAG: hypothetical protein HUU21_36935 [Polyangiaceae bacterium]|nr:hypothetical protein [Polyangiaceae bacterium]